MCTVSTSKLLAIEVEATYSILANQEHQVERVYNGAFELGERVIEIARWHFPLLFPCVERIAERRAHLRFSNLCLPFSISFLRLSIAADSKKSAAMPTTNTPPVSFGMSLILRSSHSSVHWISE